MVYCCSVKHSSHKWYLWPRNYDYKYKLLPGIAIKTLIGEFSFNPPIIKEVVKSRSHSALLEKVYEEVVKR